MQPDAQGKYPYTGSLDCVMKTLKAGGPFKFYTGFPVYCVRIAPHVMVIFLTFSLAIYSSMFSCGSVVHVLDCVLYIADDMAVPQPHSKVGEKSWFVELSLELSYIKIIPHFRVLGSDH